MSTETSRDIDLEFNPERLSKEEKIRQRANHKEVGKAGHFLMESGMSDAVLGFAKKFLQNNALITNEIYAPPLMHRASANIALEWGSHHDSRSFKLKVSAGRSDRNERYIAAQFSQMHVRKEKTVDTKHLVTVRYPIGEEELSFTDPIDARGKKDYVNWLRRNILNDDLGLL